MGEVFFTKNIYDELKQELKREIRQRKPLALASLRLNNDYSSDVYFASQEKLANELGVEYFAVEFDEKEPLAVIKSKIEELNEDENITGIIVNRPFPAAWNDAAIFSTIDYRKDIEGMCPYNLGMLLLGKPLFVSPTVLSVLKFLEIIEVDLYGKEVTIVGFSNLIGRPLAFILGQKLATVNITHIATYERERLPFYVSNADIVISAVGKPNLIKGEWIKPQAIVIDVGLGQINNRQVGDIEFDAAKEKTSFITPVPGGVGKLTPIFLFRNLLNAADLIDKL